jgi:hypothetical protein
VARSLLPLKREREEREREKESTRESEKNMGLRRKMKFFLNFFFKFLNFFLSRMGERVLIGCFPSHLSWSNNPSCPFLSGGHKGASLHQHLIQVIL